VNASVVYAKEERYWLSSRLRIATENRLVVFDTTNLGR
jgi:hypothetical protein